MMKWCKGGYFLTIILLLVASCQNDGQADLFTIDDQSDGKVVKIARDSVFLEGGERVYIPGITKGGQKIIIMTTHADTDTLGLDPGLSKEGDKRATRLTSILQSTQLKQICITHFRRMYLTVRPLAELMRCGLERYEPGDLKNFVKEVLDKPSGVYFICGNSDSLPNLIGQFGGQYVNIKENEYHGLWIVVLGDKNEFYNFTY